MAVPCNDLNIQFCDIFNVKPLRIHMHFEVQCHKFQEKSFVVKNKTDLLQVVTVSHPLTEFFEIPNLVYEKCRIKPEKSMEFQIKFLGNSEARPYYDRIIVSCSKGCEVYVKIVASPIIKDLLKIPLTINFRNVPLGEKACYKLKIPVMENKTPFLFLGSIYNPDITIQPMKGVVDKQAKTVTIYYEPKAYVTQSYPIHVYFPSLSVLPLFITVMADSKPGKMSELIFKKVEQEKKKLGIRIPFAMSNLKCTKGISKQIDVDTGWSQHKTNLFMLKKEEGKNPEYELRDIKEQLSANPRRLRLIMSKFVIDLPGPFGRYLSEEEDIKKSKQCNFLKEVLTFRKTCSEPLNHRRTVLKELKVEENCEWDLIWHDYKKNELSKSEDATMPKNRPECLRQRIIVPVQKGEKIHFTNSLPNLWFVRQQILNKFIEAARRIIEKNRLLKQLELLKKVRDEIKARQLIGHYKNA